MKIKNMFMVSILFILLTGCAMTPRQKASFKCGAISGGVGAVTGALGGLLARRGIKEIVIGATAGAVVGAATGAILCYIKATRKNKETYNYETTKKKIAYTPQQGNKIAIESIKVSPSSFKQGVQNELKVSTSYYVMTPDKEKELEVIEKWGMDLEEIATPPITLLSGTRESSMLFPIPNDAEKGTHTISLTIQYADLTSKTIKKEFIIE